MRLHYPIHRFMMAALVFASAACTDSPSSSKKTLIYCSEASPEGFDPARYTSGNTFDASAETVFDRLVEFKRGETSIEPGLATHWKISEDGKTYTFTLRSGVQFHTTSYFKPSRPFNADDVLFTFQRLINKTLPFNQAYGNDQYPFAMGMDLDKEIQSIQKRDEHTVEFTLKRVNAAFLHNLAMHFTSIQSAEYADFLLKNGRAERLNQEPVGTGPFVFERYQKDAVIRYKTNKHYWRGADTFDQLIFAITPDPSVRIQKLQKNECQIMTYPRPADLPALKKDPKLTVLSQPGFNLAFLAYNVEHKPLNQQKVRRALDIAIDKRAIVQVVYQNAAQVAIGPMPPTQWSYDKVGLEALDLETQLEAAIEKRHDASQEQKAYLLQAEKIKAAKALLKQAGFEKGFELTLWATPEQRPYNPNALLMAQMIQSDWAKIGVKAKIVSYEWGSYVQKAQHGEFDAALFGWVGDNGDPDNWLGTNLSCAAIGYTKTRNVGGNNMGRWCDPAFDALVSQARAITEESQRVVLYQKAQKIFKQQTPWSPIAHSMVFVPMRQNVENYKISPFGLFDFYGVSLK